MHDSLLDGTKPACLSFASDEFVKTSLFLFLRDLIVSPSCEDAAQANKKGRLSSFGGHSMPVLTNSLVHSVILDGIYVMVEQAGLFVNTPGGSYIHSREASATHIPLL